VKTSRWSAHCAGLLGTGAGPLVLKVYWPGGKTTISRPPACAPADRADGRAGQMRALREVIGQIRAQVTT